MIRRPPRSTQSRSSAASDVYKRQVHKKQTGGSGQYAKVQMRFEPLDAAGGELYEFVNAVTGGRIPREYIPSVDAGIQSAMELGILAGFPLVGVKATLLDGAYPV